MRYIYFLAVAFIIAVTGCQSPQGLLKKGNYDGAVYLASRKLTKKQKDKHILALEKAFKIALQKDLQKIERLKQEGNPDHWEEVFLLYSEIRQRQDMVEHLLPLYVKKEFREAEIRLINVDEELAEAKLKAAEYLYEHAIKLLETGDKFKARDAYYGLKRLQGYYPNFRDVDTQVDKAWQQGLNRVLLQVRGDHDAVLPADFTNEIKRMDIASLNNLWAQFYTRPEEDMPYDYTVNVYVKKLDPGVDRVLEREYKEEKEIRDGWQYVLDENGNVAKDTAGNDIKVAKYKLISCWVYEVHQQKSAFAAGSVDFIDNRTGQITRSIPFSETVLFENFAIRADGDERALSKETTKRLGGQPANFPPDEAIMEDVARKLKSALSSIVRSQQNLVMN